MDAIGTVERKFVGDETMSGVAREVLAGHYLPDWGYPEGWVESVCFGNPVFGSYAEKVNGDALKRKVRIRWYRDTLEQRSGRVHAYLEIKDRVYASRGNALSLLSLSVPHLEFAHCAG